MKKMAVYHHHQTNMIRIAPEDGSPLTYDDARRIADLANDRPVPLVAKVIAGALASAILALLVGVVVLLWSTIL